MQDKMVFVSNCYIGRKTLRQLRQKKSESNHLEIALTLIRVMSFTGLRITWQFSHNIMPVLQ